MRRRYFTLSDGVLAWYESERSTTAKNSAPVAGLVAQAVASPGSGGRFAFTIMLPQSAQHATLNLEAEAESERAAWLAALA